MEYLLREDQAIEQLRAAIDACGTLAAFAKRVGESPGNVSLMRSGKRPITGKVAAYLGLTPTISYLKMGTVLSPEQERYVKNRQKYREQMGYSNTRMRSVRG